MSDIQTGSVTSADGTVIGFDQSGAGPAVILVAGALMNRSKDFFTELGLAFFGQAEDMASVIISEHTQVMLLTEAVFASYARRGVVDATAGTEVILVLGVETRDQVDELASKAEAAGGSPVGTPRDDGYRYQRGFTDLDGHHWEALCLIDPAS